MEVRLENGADSRGVCPPSLMQPLQVVAVVMDMFTDVDLLSEVLEAAARRVPVYILLDEMNAQHFLDMADKCRVNLHHVDVSDRERGYREGGRPFRRDLTPLPPSSCACALWQAPPTTAALGSPSRDT